MNPKKVADLKPTEQAYGELQHAYDFYNEKLFDNKLPGCLLTFQRNKNVMGYYSHNRFISADGLQRIDEIALNPEFFASFPIIEIMQSLCHEMTHQLQFRFGNPSRRGYHNAQWAAMMERIGLIPSSTGTPGGAKVGQHIADYPAPNGRFQHATLELFHSGFAVSWFDRFPVRITKERDLTAVIDQWRETLQSAALAAQQGTTVIASEELISMALTTPLKPKDEYGTQDTASNDGFGGPPTLYAAKQSGRHKYICSCRYPAAVYGKPGLNILCLDCKQNYVDTNL
jgi:hypothetical protein